MSPPPAWHSHPPTPVSLAGASACCCSVFLQCCLSCPLPLCMHYFPSPSPSSLCYIPLLTWLPEYFPTETKGPPQRNSSASHYSSSTITTTRRGHGDGTVLKMLVLKTQRGLEFNALKQQGKKARFSNSICIIPVARGGGSVEKRESLTYLVSSRSVRTPEQHLRLLWLPHALVHTCTYEPSIFMP